MPPAARERALAAIPSRRPRSPHVAGFGQPLGRRASRSQPRAPRPRRHRSSAAAPGRARPDQCGGVRRESTHPAGARGRTVGLRARWRRLPRGRGWRQPGARGARRARPVGEHDLGSRRTPLPVPSWWSHVSDPDGRVVGSLANLPGFNGYPVWSPTRPACRRGPTNFTRIGVYGIDGSLQTELSLPDGYTRSRETLGSGPPMGGRCGWGSSETRSFPARPWIPAVRRPSWIPRHVPSASTGSCPIDGSAPSPAPGGLDLTYEWSFAPDGSRVAFSDEDQRLSVANLDGTDRRPVIRADDGAGQGLGVHPVWSPAGDEIAYYVSGYDDKYGLNVVDVATRRRSDRGRTHASPAGRPTPGHLAATRSCSWAKAAQRGPPACGLSAPTAVNRG